MHGTIKEQMNRYPIFSYSKNKPSQANTNNPSHNNSFVYMHNTHANHIQNNSNSDLCGITSNLNSNASSYANIHPHSRGSGNKNICVKMGMNKTLQPDSSKNSNKINNEEYIDESQLFKDEEIKLSNHQIQAQMYNHNHYKQSLNHKLSNPISQHPHVHPHSQYSNFAAYAHYNNHNYNFSTPNKYDKYQINHPLYSTTNNNDQNKKNKKNLSLFTRIDKYNQTIINIYDKIQNNNASDPIYLHASKQQDRNRELDKYKQDDKQVQPNNQYDTVISSRNSTHKLDKNIRKNKRTNSIVSKFMGELAQSINNSDKFSASNKQAHNDTHRAQKISLLKRIIEHYNIKSVQRKYYSNLIKNFGIKIQSINSNEIAFKKSIHPRQNANSLFKNLTTKQQPKNNNDNQSELVYYTQLQQKTNQCIFTQEVNLDSSTGISQSKKNIQIQTKSKTSQMKSKGARMLNHVDTQKKSKDNDNMRKKIKAANSYVFSKQFSISNSRESIRENQHTSSGRVFVQNMTIQTNNAKNISGIKYKEQASQKMRRSIEYSQKLVQKPIRMQGSTSTQDKVNKYRDFLFLLNYSNGLYCELDIDKYQKNFKYYVGPGNNGNLIKSLMKKRFWFQQTSDPFAANFVWTQIKIQQIYQKQIKVIKKQMKSKQKEDQLKILDNSIEQNRDQEDPATQTDKKNLDGNIDVHIEPTQNYQNIKNQIKRHQNFLNNKQIRFGKCKTRARDYAPQDPLLKIVTLQDARAFREILQALYYKKCPTFFDKLKLSNKQLHIIDNLSPNINKNGKEEQVTFLRIHNHFPFNGLLGNKKALFYNLKQYCKLSNKKISQYIPMTYHIKKGIADEQYKSITCVYNDRKKQKLPNFWIMKPGQYSNRGQGITCTNKLQDIRQRVNKCRELSKAGKQSSLIVQLYISNPLLYNGRKFDIRVFMMITIHGGKIKGYWYQEGYVRTSSFQWNLTQMEDKYIHLTNDAIQKTCQQYGLYEPGNKLTFTDLQRYLHTLPKNGRNMQFFEAIYPSMRKIATDAIRSVCLNIDPRRLCNNFEIFGLDFMVDQNVKPWLIEVNTNPCLQLNCPILQRILPHMVQNALRIAVDPLFPPPTSLTSDYKYSIPQNALHYNKFQLVFDQDRDGQVLAKLYKTSNILQQLKQLNDLQEDQELFEGDGDMIDIKDQ